MIDIDNIEIHAAHGCDHSCTQCTHFSNYNLGGVLQLEDADEHMGYWSHRLNPRWFSILGGEPTLHPRLSEFVELACLHWPHVRVITNGSFLHRHPELPSILEKYGVFLELSVHHSSPEYCERVVKIKQLLNDWLIDYTFQINIRESFAYWLRTFRGEGNSLKPYADNAPENSWHECRSKWCPQIYDGKIYKCPQAAYLPMLNKKIDLDDDWNPYLNYLPLAPGCSDEDLEEFISRRVEPICKMCPAQPESVRLPNPLPQLIHHH